MSRLSKLFNYGVVTLALSSPVFAIEYQLPSANDDLIGQMQVIKAKYEDTFADLGDTYSLGFSQMVAANPGVDAWLPGAGTDILLPTRYILPDVPREGIVINLPEYRLYYYPKGKNLVYTFPLGIGREGWGSPLGVTKIVSKIKDPSWYPPASIRKEHAEEGDILPTVVPPGPDNPLGPYKMNLGFSGYLIHGSNQLFGVGTRTSHGCFRMLNPDVTRLVAMVPMGTKVNIVTEPYKVGIEGGKIYLEAHQPLEEYPAPDLTKLLLDAQKKYNKPGFVVDMSIAKMVADHHDGIPVQIGNTDGTPMQTNIPVEIVNSETEQNEATDQSTGEDEVTTEEEAIVDSDEPVVVIQEEVLPTEALVEVQ